MEQPIILTIGFILESCRHHHFLTVTDMAREAHVARQTIIRIETEASYPRRETLQKLAQVLNINIDELEALQEKLESKETRHRIGKQSRRDHEFPELKDSEFRKWWHRKGKAMNGGRDIASREEARERYQEWKSAGCPRVKLLTRELLIAEVGRSVHLTRNA